MLCLLQSMPNPGFICPHNMGQTSVLIKGCILSLAYMLTNKACSPLISANMFKPGTHNMIPETAWQGWVGMLVASLPPGQMARLLGEEEASWRGVTALQRAQSRTEQKCWQLLMHLPERKETRLTKKSLHMRLRVFTFSLAWPSRAGWLRSKGGKLIKKHIFKHRQRNVCLWVNLPAWKGCTAPKNIPFIKIPALKRLL